MLTTCPQGPQNFNVAVTPNDVTSDTITYGTFNLWCGYQNPIPPVPTGLTGI